MYFRFNELTSVCRWHRLRRAGCHGAMSCALTLWITAVCAGSELHVPRDFRSIQDAIDNAGPGDHIIVAPGLYVETIDLLGKSVTLRSSAGAEVTSIDGNREATVIRCVSGEGQSTVIDGFTITGGQGSSGDGNDSAGGMINSGSHPTILNCTFENNTASDDASGMLNVGSSPTIIACQFRNNIGPADGGAIYNTDNSNPTIVNCLFESNHVVGSGVVEAGGAILNQLSSSPIIINCQFRENVADFGGAIANYADSNPSIIGCTLTGNSAVSGGAIYSEGGSVPSITDSVVCENTEAQIVGSMRDSDGNCIALSCADCALPCPADIAPPGNPDGAVGAADLGELLANWGQCPGTPGG
jgi:predicted outer membrane repeat protein